MENDFKDFDVEAFDSVKKEEEESRKVNSMNQQLDIDDQIRLGSNTYKTYMNIDWGNREYIKDRYEKDSSKYRHNEVNGHSTLSVTIAIIITIIFSVILTSLYIWIIGDVTDSQLRVQNSKYKEQVEQLEETIEEYEKKVSEFEYTIEKSGASSQSDKETIDKLNDKIDELNIEIDKLKSTISDLKIELTEAQYRADMYQKFPFWDY